jgi:aminoglycoside phosphotransferase (APT) family kinase protein
MALKNTLDAGEVTARLASWLPGALGVPGPVEVVDVEMPTASGMSSETVLLTVREGASTRGLVVRVPPQLGLFPDYDVAREAKVMNALAEHTGAPVPRVLAHERSDDVLGGEFLLVERAYGKVPGDDPPFVAGGWVVELTPDQRATMFDSALRGIAAFQAADPLAVGLGDLQHADLGDDVIAQELAYWRRFYAWAHGERPSTLIEQAFDQLEASRPSADRPLVVSWGDARFGNMMFGEDCEVTAILDWEMATLGPREVDLGYFLFFDRLYSEGIGAPRLPGFPERAAAIARYEELTGHAVADLDWFEAWAALRGSILMLRVGNLMIEHGQLPPDAPLPLNNPAAHVLAALTGLEMPQGEAQWITGSR